LDIEFDKLKHWVYQEHTGWNDDKLITVVSTLKQFWKSVRTRELKQLFPHSGWCGQVRFDSLCFIGL